METKKCTADEETRAIGILDKYMYVADCVLKNLVAHTINKKVENVFDSHMNTQASIEVPVSGSHKYTLQLRMVPKDYMLDLKEFKNPEDIKVVKEAIMYLIKAVMSLYRLGVQKYMTIWAKKNNTIFDYSLCVGQNTTLYLDEHCEKRIGIVLTCIRDHLQKQPLQEQFLQTIST